MPTEREILREKLAFLQAEEAKAPPGEQKFAIQMSIREVEARLRELKAGAAETGPSERRARGNRGRLALAGFVLLVLAGVWWVRTAGFHGGRDCRPPLELIDRGSGRLSDCVDGALRLTRISYQNDVARGGGGNTAACDLPVPEPLDIEVVPAFFDEEERCAKLSTVSFAESGAYPRWPRVPAKVRVEIAGIEPEESVLVHVLTDDQYPIRATVGGTTASAALQIGVEGFLPYLELLQPLRPRLPVRPVKNMPAIDSGPVALLVITAADRKGRWRRSKPYPVVRSGVRSPSDVWLLEGRLPLAFATPGLPPLVVFQSRIRCEPPWLQGIFAATLDGQEVYRLSPPVPYQFTLVRVEPGPPGKVFFRGAAGATRHCYRVELNGGPITPEHASADDSTLGI